MFEVVKLFMATIEEKHKGLGDYFEFTSKIYDEYFDNRAYLLDQYLNVLGNILEGNNYVLDEYVKVYLENYTGLIKDER
jgi:hypothetical protein